MGRRMVFFLLLAVVLCVSEAQLTFSTGWGNGKRSAHTEIGSNACAPEESLYIIFKIIQAEAERLIACRNDGKK